MARPKPTKPRHTVNFRVDLESYEVLKAYADEHDISFSQLANKIFAKAAKRIQAGNLAA